MVGVGHDGGRFVVDSDLEASWAPVDELDRSLHLDVGDGSVDIFGDDVASVEQAAGHVLALLRIAFDHLVRGLEAGSCDFLKKSCQSKARN